MDDILGGIRQFYEDHRGLVWIGVGLVAVFILAWGVLAAVDHRNEVDVARRVTEAEAVMTMARSRIETAKELVSTRRGDFPSKYSNQFTQPLLQAEQRINQFFEPSLGLLAQLHDAQARREWKVAYELLSQVENLKSQDVAVIDRILGPPGTEGQGFYDGLDFKVREVDAGLITTIQGQINDVETYIEMLPEKALCGSDEHFLSFAEAKEELVQAQQELDKSVSTASVVVEGMIDKPLVFDQAVAAQMYAESAKKAVDDLSAQADDAISQIQDCEGAITSAADYLLTHHHRSGDSAAQLDSARSENQSAYNACYAQDFTEVKRHVESCVSLADKAVWFATEPTPTPEPTSTPIPVVDDDDDNTWSTGSWGTDDDSGSDSGSWDSGSWDSGDSGSWDSGSWDSGDSGSWDSSDWDSGDSGSWDSDW